MKILSCKNIRAAEENAVKCGVTLSILMKNAGSGAARFISKQHAVAGKNICVVCGKGNNGGDGLIVANELSLMGASVRLVMPDGLPASEPATDFSYMAETLKKLDDIPNECDILIDALFGIGLSRELDGRYADIVGKMNRCKALKIALDLPSGLFCDSGAVKTAFVADETVTFIAPKICFFLPPAGEYCGNVSVIDIGAEIVEYSYKTVEYKAAEKRKKYSHKGDYGTVLTVCGSYGMCGASILAARSALRSGAGLVKSVVPDKNYVAFCNSVPEAVTVPVPTSAQGVPVVEDGLIEELISSCDALLIGCGLSRENDALKLVKKVLCKTNVPVVIDADGINAICHDIGILRNIKAPIVLTPHSGEMARLCNTTVESIESDRIGYAQDFAVSHGCTLVLKGANTVIASPNGEVFINTTGNSGMATGGSGDVLAGMIVSLLAQGDGATDAVCKAVYLHGLAGDRALEKCSMSALLPSDIIVELKTLFI